MLAKEGIQLLVSAYYDEAAYRILYERGHIVEKGLAILRGALRRAVDLRRAGDCDLVIIHRESAPIGPPYFERLLRRTGRSYVFDFDDALFLGPIHPANRRWAWLRSRNRTEETVSGAAAVIAGNTYLAEWALPFNRNVTVIPTSVDTERHTPRPRERKGPVVIGWIGSSTTAPYLHLLDRVLDRLADRPDVELRVIGGDYQHRRFPVRQLPYRLEYEPGDIASFDIGILPEPDDPWTRGKGALKALLYMATALPVVASRVGVNPEVIIDDVTGFCVATEEDWIERLTLLIDDSALRHTLGAAGRARVEERYSVRAQVPRLAAVLRTAGALT